MYIYICIYILYKVVIVTYHIWTKDLLFTTCVKVYKLRFTAKHSSVQRPISFVITFGFNKYIIKPISQL